MTLSNIQSEKLFYEMYPYKLVIKAESSELKPWRKYLKNKNHKIVKAWGVSNVFRTYLTDSTDLEYGVKFFHSKILEVARLDDVNHLKLLQDNKSARITDRLFFSKFKISIKFKCNAKIDEYFSKTLNRIFSDNNWILDDDYKIIDSYHLNLYFNDTKILALIKLALYDFIANVTILYHPTDIT